MFLFKKLLLFTILVGILGFVVFGSFRVNAIDADNSLKDASKNDSGLSISPIIQELEAMPGKNYELEYTIDNQSSQSIVETEMSVETFKEGSVQGSANVVPFEPDKDYSKWLEVPAVQRFESNKSTKVRYRVLIPDDIESGAYFFAIVYKPKNQGQQPSLEKNSVIIQSRIASLLFINIGGDKSKQPEISNFTTNLTWIDPFFDNLELKYDVAAKGSSFYRPMGNLFLEPANSDKINILASIASEQLILPNNSRSYNNCLQSIFQFSKCTETEQLEAKLPWYGNAILALRFDYTDGNNSPQSAVSKNNLVIFPYKTLLLSLAALLLLSFIILKLNKFRKKHVKYIQN